MISPCPRIECQMHHGTISRMGRQPTILGLEHLKGHHFLAFWLDLYFSSWRNFVAIVEEEI